MGKLKFEDLSELNGGSKVCEFCAGAGLAALLTANVFLGGAATLCGVGCVFSWW